MNTDLINRSELNKLMLDKISIKQLKESIPDQSQFDNSLINKIQQLREEVDTKFLPKIRSIDERVT